MYVQKGVERQTRFSIFKFSVFKLWEPANHGINQIVGTIILGLLLNDGLCVGTIIWCISTFSGLMSSLITMTQSKSAPIILSICLKAADACKEKG